MLKKIFLIIATFLIVQMFSLNLVSARVRELETKEIETILREKIPNSKIVSLVYEEKHEPTYNGKVIRGSNEYDVTINGITGEFMNLEKNKIDFFEESYKGRVISEEVAKNIMIKKAKSSKIINIRYDGSDPIPKYYGIISVEGKKAEVTVDARNGSVIGYYREDLERR